ncbi:MAG: histone deacetylase, partial [Saprospiraceae bacterium]|nr:histone deacetylase [Saprospiraceae bacterium]
SFSDHGEGFCLFNDIAIAANILLSKNKVKKILIVDLDVHQGNGTANIFSNISDVFTFSMHGEKNYPTRKESSDFDIGMPDKCEDLYYLRCLKEVLPKLLDNVQPDFIFYLAGVDILESDKLGRLSISKQGCKERDRYVLQLAKDNKIPIAVTMGGGYSPKIADIIDAHANTFRLAQEIYF